MIEKKLKERLFLVKATPLPDRAKDSFANRRDTRGLVMEESEDAFEKYDTFFDYEDDLASLKPSGEQYAEMVTSDPYVILEDREHQAEDNNLSLDMPELKAPIIMECLEDNSEKKTYKDVVGFEFIQCEYTKSNGQRCKRQAPNGQDICSVHKKYIEKHGH